MAHLGSNPNRRDLGAVGPKRSADPAARQRSSTGALTGTKLVALVAALLLAVAGVVAAITHEGTNRCDRLRSRLEAMGYRPTPPQHWHDIYTLQEHVTDGLRVQAEFDDAGCAW